MHFVKKYKGEEKKMPPSDAKCCNVLVTRRYFKWHNCKLDSPPYTLWRRLGMELTAPWHS